MKKAGSASLVTAAVVAAEGHGTMTVTPARMGLC